MNSYKRVQDASFAPVNATWGHDSRTVAIRSLLGEGGGGSRLELRNASADADPYLAIAAAIAGGLHGIERRLELKDPPQAGSAYQAKAARLPESLHQALALLEVSAVARDASRHRGTKMKRLIAAALLAALLAPAPSARATPSGVFWTPGSRPRSSPPASRLLTICLARPRAPGSPPSRRHARAGAQARAHHLSSAEERH